jgi:hypothetical protein
VNRLPQAGPVNQPRNPRRLLYRLSRFDEGRVGAVVQSGVREQDHAFGWASDRRI